MLNRFIDYLNNSTTQFHAVAEGKKKLSAAGYKELNMYSDWKLEKGGKYMISPFSSCLFAINIGNEIKNIRITSCHTDFPMLKLKSKPEIDKKGYLQANVEAYGGLIKESWFDRPLAIAGKVVLKSDDVFKPEVKLYDSKKPLCIIPNLAPHLKKDGKNDSIDMQKEFLPIFGFSNEKLEESWLVGYIAKDMGIDEEEILDFDLYIYNIQKACVVGMNDEMLTSPRIDNLSSAFAMLEALCDNKLDNNENVVIGAFFDNEEIGSRSKQGADSTLLRDIYEKVLSALAVNNVCDNTDKLKENSFSISLDVAHGLHPNYTEKNDITNEVILGKGVVLKASASQRYVTDSEAGAVIVALCEKKDIKLQRAVNRSGMPGGQTLGPIMSSYLPIKSVDMGIPVLAMHSALELSSVTDYNELVKLIRSFYEE